LEYMNKFKLKFKPSQINKLASVYDYQSDKEIIESLVPRARKSGYINKADFLKLCEWKTPRSKPLCRQDSEELVREITGIALKTKNEKLKIEILTLLEGVSWPTASTLLHFVSNFNYPILDFRALWSLGYEDPPIYNFDFWNDYTNYCRKVSEENNVSLRVFDKALWQYSAENQE
jgi:hypothetical protein